MDLARVPESERPDIDQFVAANVPCLKPEFIASHLTDHPAPQPHNFLIPEVQAIKKYGRCVDQGMGG